MGGMGLARPVLNAMKVDDMRDFHYKTELYDEIYTSTEIYEKRTRGLKTKSSFVPDYNSDAEPKTMTENKPRFRRGLRGAGSFSNHISKRVTENI